MPSANKSKAHLGRELDPVRERIVKAARAHFFQHGFRGVTMDELAAEMAMSKKTLYVHFQSKRDLLDAVLDQKFSELEEEMEAIQARAQREFAQTLESLLACMRKHMGEVTPTFARDLAKEDPELFAKIKSRRSELMSRSFGAILRRGQKARAVRRDISAEMLVEILLSIANSVATPQNVAAKGLAPGDVLSSILSVFLEGALVRKGGRSS